MTRLHKKDYFKGKLVQRRAVLLLLDFINSFLWYGKGNSLLRLEKQASRASAFDKSVREGTKKPEVRLAQMDINAP